METKRVGALADRDPDLMDALREYFLNKNVETVDITSGITGKSPLDTESVKVILPKLKTSSSNKKLFKKLRKTKLHFLNSLKAVNACQSRRRQFALLKKKAPSISTPKVFRSLKSIKKTFKQGKQVWVRKDAHNIPKEERVIGIATSLEDLYDLIRDYKPGELFFQEYLGEKEVTFKAYVIGQNVFCLKKSGLQDGFERDTEELREVRCDMPSDLKDVVLIIGDVFKMAVYGVDILYHEGRPIVVDINDFPSFRGIEEAVETIYEYIQTHYL